MLLHQNVVSGWQQQFPALMNYKSVSVMFDAWERNAAKCGYKNVLLAFFEFEYFERIYEMSKGKSSAATTKTAANWRGYRNIDLQQSDKEYLLQNPVEDEELWVLLGEVVASGHRITFSKKADKPATVVTFTGSEPTCKNVGYSLSSFAPTLRKAAVVNLYKHIHLSSGVWAQAAADDDEEYG